MSTPTVDRTGDWDSVPFSGGYAGLRTLADDEFSGMVTAGPARLFMLRGSVIGILDGDVEDFEDGGGTAREAPHPALPLLAVMQERSEEVRAEYYTEETPISEVDRTLADGNFTGYVELSENVLSGDYYQVYHQGRSMSVAYVGASERLIVDDEAFEQADDEVGIYKVRPVDVDVIEIPEPDDGGGAAGVAGTDETDATDDPGSGGQDAGTTGHEDGSDGTESDESSGTTADDAATDAGAETEAGAADTGASATEDATTDDTVSTADEPAAGGTAADDATPAAEDATATGHSSTETTSPPTEDDSAEPSGTDVATEAGGATGANTPSTEAPAPDAPSSDGRQGDTADAGGQRSGTGSEATDTGQSGDSRQGRPASDHPAAAGDGQTGQSSAPESTAGDRSSGSIGAGNLEVHSLPSLDPSRTASASRQERERRSSAAGGGAGDVEGPQRTTQHAERTDPDAGAGQASSAQPDPAGGDTPGNRPTAQAAEGNGGGVQQGANGATEQPVTDASQAQSADADATGGQSTSETTAGQPATSDGSDAQQADATEAAGTANGSESAGETDAGLELEQARAEVERLESELSDLRGDHEAVVEERDRLEAELAEAREEIDRLQDRLEDAAGGASAASRALTPREAIDETNLFIRYDSKGEATLEKAHAGEVDAAAVDENMRLEYHTSFDADDAAVDGIDFDAFLTDTVQYRFVDWLVRKLLYEIRDTGNTGPMGDLYDALPDVDRAELNGQVGVQYSEDGQEHRSQVGFDVIVRDRMGNPLIVANLNDSRDPATESMMTDLVRSAERVGETSSSLAGAFLVTRSFFEPEALETAEEATAGGLLNRGKQKSFVNLSRKGGYHLCLVEARNEEFHLAVPEL